MTDSIPNSTPSYLLDTCFILGFYNRNEEALNLINDNKIKHKQCAISVINRMEALGYAKLDDESEQDLSEIMANFECKNISQEVEQETIRLRKLHKIKLPDAIILATANVYQLQLLTFDQKLQRIYGQYG